MEMCKGRPVKKLRDKNFTRKDMMDKPEMLIKKYRIQDWGDDTYKGGDEARKLIPSPARTQARGLMRFSRAVADGWCDKDGCPIAKRKAPVAQGSIPDMQSRQEPEPAV